MSDPTDSVRIDIFIKAPPAAVFPYLTEPHKMRQWFGVAHRLEPRPGGEFWVDVHDGNVASGRFVEIVPPRRVVFTWGWEQGGMSAVLPGSTTVEIELAPEGDGTRLTLTHRGLGAAAGEAHRKGWTHYAGRLALAGAGGDPGPDTQIEGIRA